MKTAEMTVSDVTRMALAMEEEEKIYIPGLPENSKMMK